MTGDRRCKRPGCHNRIPVGSRRNRAFCSPSCKSKVGYARRRAHNKATQAAYREVNRDRLRQREAERRAVKREAINAAERARTRQRDIERQLERPRCIVCSYPLTPKQFRRGVTCGPTHATKLWRWKRAA